MCSTYSVRGMSLLDSTLVILFTFSAILFLTVVDSLEVKIVSINLEEGKVSGNGRQGFAHISIQNPINRSVNCTVYLTTFQFELPVSHTNISTTIFPGIQNETIEIYLPNGENEVKLNVECH